ncbi:MAG: hypothetical protein NVSMB9_14150 [Isosphaeraceae bacterium]
MRIGFDMLALQSPHHGQRGIGRFAGHLVEAMVAQGKTHEFFSYQHAGLPLPSVPRGPNVQLRLVASDSPFRPAPSPLDWLVNDNPDALDVLIILSAFEYWRDYLPPRPTRNGPMLAALVHDLIPFVFPAEFHSQTALRRFSHILESLRLYDLLLTNSEATRGDVLSILKLPPDQVETISGASHSHLFTPAEGALQPGDRQTLRDLGIVRPYVLNVGGMDTRKNPCGLIDAFALLPGSLRRSHQLSFSFDIAPHEADALRRHAQERGVAEAVVVTGHVTDAQLRLLYQRCAAFAFPSRYEGFGLPLLEALHSGVPVVAGNNSSQREVVGDAGLLANANDPADFAAKLARVLSEPALAENFRKRAVRQASLFSWEKTAGRTLSAIEKRFAGRPVACRPALRRPVRAPRIAFFSQLPPSQSSVSEDSESLLRELRHRYTIDVYHESGSIPFLGLAGEVNCLDYRLFERYAGAIPYHAVVYQIACRLDRCYFLDILPRVPGIIILDELRRVGLSPRRWFLGSKHHVIVHSSSSRNRLVGDRHELLSRSATIPFGATPRTVDPSTRKSIRDRFTIPSTAFLVTDFGLAWHDRTSFETLDAFADLAPKKPSAFFVFAGGNIHGEALQRHAATLGLESRVRVIGPESRADLVDLISITDLALDLRMPAANDDEPSQTLVLLLASGVATIVADLPAYSDIPSGCVYKLRHEERGVLNLREAMIALATDRNVRANLEQSALEHARTHHDWSRVGEQYAEMIERCHAAMASTWKASARTVHDRIALAFDRGGGQVA